MVWSSAASSSRARRVWKSATEFTSPKTPCTTARARALDRRAGAGEDHVDPRLGVRALHATQPPPLLVGQMVGLLVVDLDHRALAQRELHVRLDQLTQRLLGRLGTRTDLTRTVEELVDDAVDQRDEQLVLAREVPVDRRAAHARGRADLGDADTVEAALGDELRGRVEQALAPVLAARGLGHVSTSGEARATDVRRS